MSEWQTVLVKDLVKDKVLEKPFDGNHGETHPKGTDFIASGIPFIMASDIGNGKVDLINCKFISESQAKTLRKGFALTGDVLLTHKASLGRTAIVPRLNTPFIMLTPQVTYYRVSDYEKLSNLYLKYFFDSPFFQETLLNHGDAGSTRAYIGITAQLELPIIMPPLPEQQAIASVLSSLDDKIDLLHRQNKTLEEMAETLFRQWFIEEAQEDWEELILKELVKVIDNRGKTPPYQDFKTEHPIIEVNALTDNSRLVNYSVIRKFVDESTFQTWFRQHLEDLDILFSTVGSIGSIGMFFKNGACVAQNVIGIRAINKISNFYLYQWLLHNQEEIKELDIGSVQPSIKVPHLLALKIKIPDKNLLCKFDLVIKDFIGKLKSNQQQIQTLENLRNTLLPKLMSGEIRVKF